MKSLSATWSEVGSRARVGAPPLTPGKVRLTLLDGEAWARSSGSGEAQGNSRRFAHLNAKSLTRPITPMTMMPKMIWSVASSAWLSVIMWPMPLEAPISSATIT